MYVQADNTSASSYRLVAEKYGVTPEELHEAIVKYKKEKHRVYMRGYMRRRRGSQKVG
jgi:UDP-N-acetylmuramoylalanine-D-glutamate ligase